MRLVGIVTLIVLAVGGHSAANIISGTPAFNTELRQSTVYGDWRTGYSADMYDQAAYLFQLGYGRVTADLLFSDDTEAIGEVADAATGLQRAEEAVALLSESLSLDPANAHAWATLAWAATMTSDLDLAQEALSNSWTLAPHNSQLADRRVDLVATLTSPDGFEPLALSAFDSAALSDDLKLLEARNPRALADYIEISPELGSLLGATDTVSEG